MNRNRLIGHGLSRIPGLKRLPILKLLVLAEVAVLALRHFERLNDQERHRLFELLKTSRGRPGNLTGREREELESLVAKMEPRLFAGDAVNKLSPFPLPRRFTHGPKQARPEREKSQGAA
jgi:hypothetical protein